MPREGAARSIVAAIAGYSTNAVLVGVSEHLLPKFLSDTNYLLADLVSQCIYTIFSGYLCCLIAKRFKRIAAAGLTGIGLIVGTISLAGSWNAEPHWYGMALLAAYGPCVGIGWALERRSAVDCARMHGCSDA